MSRGYIERRGEGVLIGMVRGRVGSESVVRVVNLFWCRNWAGLGR